MTRWRSLLIVHFLVGCAFAKPVAMPPCEKKEFITLTWFQSPVGPVLSPGLTFDKQSATWLTRLSVHPGETVFLSTMRCGDAPHDGMVIWAGPQPGGGQR